MNLRIDCYLVITLYLGTKKRTRRHIEEGLEAWRTNKGARVKMEAQTKLTSSPFRSPGAVCIKLVIQVAYGLGFGRYRYVQKANKKTFPMVLVGGPNSSGVVRNRQN
jgi:hypothetical protein